MKAASLILLIAGCVLLRQTAFASASHLAPQQAPGNSNTAASDHSSDAQHATLATEGRARKESTASDEGVGLRTSDKINPQRHTNPTKTTRPKQVQRSRERSKPQNATNVQQPSLTKTIPAASRTANHRTPPIRSAPSAGISGEQFKNGHLHSLTPAAIGGPAITRRNTATLNGTSLSRKHVN